MQTARFLFAVNVKVSKYADQVSCERVLQYTVEPVEQARNERMGEDTRSYRGHLKPHSDSVVELISNRNDPFSLVEESSCESEKAVKFGCRVK